MYFFTSSVFGGRKFISWLKYANYMVAVSKRLQIIFSVISENIQTQNILINITENNKSKGNVKRRKTKEENGKNGNKDFQIGMSFLLPDSRVYQNQGYYQNYGQNNFGGYSKPYTDFKNKFESCCKSWNLKIMI